MEVLNRVLTIAGADLEVQLIGDVKTADVSLVFLHEGLGSVAQWKDFPRAVAEASGMPALVYSRAGYGRSSPCALPRPHRYMEEEARNVLPPLLEAAGLRHYVLVGHSDGASIAIAYASGFAAIQPSRLRGLVLEAPHVICEDISVASITKAREAYEHGDLRERLAKYHHHVDCAFRGWNDAWLHPGFRKLDLRAHLLFNSAPTLVIQGEDDEYGTRAQVDEIAAKNRGPVTVRMLPACGHAPHRDQPELTLREILTFLTSIGVTPAR
ncbi:MAG: alpha/beta hydrolase [Polyangiales bacterium]